jgi:hypothetical protein
MREGGRERESVCVCAHERDTYRERKGGIEGRRETGTYRDRESESERKREAQERMLRDATGSSEWVRSREVVGGSGRRNRARESESEREREYFGISTCSSEWWMPLIILTYTQHPKPSTLKPNPETLHPTPRPSTPIPEP